MSKIVLLDKPLYLAYASMRCQARYYVPCASCDLFVLTYTLIAVSEVLYVRLIVHVSIGR